MRTRRLSACNGAEHLALLSSVPGPAVQCVAHGFLEDGANCPPLRPYIAVRDMLHGWPAVRPLRARRGMRCLGAMHCVGSHGTTMTTTTNRHPGPTNFGGWCYAVPRLSRCGLPGPCAMPAVSVASSVVAPAVECCEGHPCSARGSAVCPQRCFAVPGLVAVEGLVPS